MLQDEILRIEEYFRGIEYYNKAIIVKVMFPDKWQVFPSNDGKVKPAKADNGEYYYYGSSDNVTLDDIFTLIKATIDSNRHAEEKIQFLLSKRKELDELFRTTPFEKLKTLTFEFKPQKKSRKQRKKKEEAVEVKETEIVEDTSNATDETIGNETQIINEPINKPKKKKQEVKKDND